MQETNNNRPDGTVHSYVRAIFAGACEGILDLINIVVHPLDECVYPMTNLLYDAAIISAAHFPDEHIRDDAADAAILKQFALQNQQCYRDAVNRMQSRVNDIRAAGADFLNADGPQRTEALSRFVTTVVVPGGIVKGAKAVAKLHRYGVLFEPPRFVDTYGERPLLRSVENFTESKIRALTTPQTMLYVASPDGKLFMSPKFQNVGQGGFRLIGEIHHQEFGLLEVISAGEVNIQSGAQGGYISKITNESGRFAPGGNHLATVVERVFVRNGFREATGKFENAYQTFHPVDRAGINPQINIRPSILGMLSSLPFAISNLNPRQGYYQGASLPILNSLTNADSITPNQIEQTDYVSDISDRISNSSSGESNSNHEYSPVCIREGRADFSYCYAPERGVNATQLPPSASHLGSPQRCTVEFTHAGVHYNYRANTGLNVHIGASDLVSTSCNNDSCEVLVNTDGSYSRIIVQCRTPSPSTFVTHQENLERLYTASEQRKTSTQSLKAPQPVYRSTQSNHQTSTAPVISYSGRTWLNKYGYGFRTEEPPKPQAQGNCSPSGKESNGNFYVGSSGGTVSTAGGDVSLGYSTGCS